MRNAVSVRKVDEHRILTTEMGWLRKLAGISKQKTKEEKRRYQNNYIFLKPYSRQRTHISFGGRSFRAARTRVWPVMTCFFLSRNILFSCH